jgi:1-acyl-sn-glycerol-3-phosphate acyltransferase
LTDQEYRCFRDLVDSGAGQEELEKHWEKTQSTDLLQVCRVPRRDYKPASEPYSAFIRRWMGRLMALVEAKTTEALFQKENNVIVFPQGTRSLRLLPARTGMLQFAIRHQVDVVPIGSNGCERLYPGASPLAKGGRVVYRIGKPLTMDGEFRDLQIEAPYIPFTQQADPFEETFQRAAARVTTAIDDLLDEPYKLEKTAGMAAVSEVGRLI